MVKDMKIGIFIDGRDLFCGLNGKRINFGKFKKWILSDGEDGYAGYFTCVDDIEAKINFFNHVKHSGFYVFVRKPKYDIEKKCFVFGSMNVELAVEAMYHVNDYDKFVIVSGKHDFFLLCKKLENLGKEIEVIGFKNTVSNIFNKYNIRYIEDFLEYVD